jgi:4-hydroxybenzoate polyprenyltransferase
VVLAGVFVSERAQTRRNHPGTGAVVDTAGVRFRKNPGTAVSLVLCGHPLFALLVAAGVAVAAALAGRSLREVGLVFVTVLLGRLTAGWLNDVADRERDIAVDRQDKPIARDWVHPSTVTFTVACVTLLVIPLSVSNGTYAGIAHLLSVAAAWTYNTRVKLTALSWVPWAVSFGLLPTFLSYGGWGGGLHGGPATPALTVLAALLGVGIHVALALPDLVADNRNGVRSLPMLIALKTGAAKLLYATIAYLVVVGAALVYTGLTVGLQA